jgi:hypothetical protein
MQSESCLSAVENRDFARWNPAVSVADSHSKGTPLVVLRLFPFPAGEEVPNVKDSVSTRKSEPISTFRGLLQARYRNLHIGSYRKEE